MSLTETDYDGREQSAIKHFVLRLYLEAAARILGTTRNLKYIDCCAGPWETKSARFEDASFGIAVRTLKEASVDLAKRNRSPQLACLFIERDTEAFRKLDAFAKESDSSAVRVHARNWDFSERQDDIVRYCTGRNTFPFIFIDPTGWQLAGISKIRGLLHLNPGEVLINLMSPFIARFIKDNRTDFSDLLGSDFPELRRLSGSKLEYEIVRKYCEMIRDEGGFEYVCSLPIMNPDNDSFNFHLIYATRHRKGVEVFKDVERRTAKMTAELRASVQSRARHQKTGNFELFTPEVQYRENRYQELVEDNIVRAGSLVFQMLKTLGEATYDDCWAEALQHSGVFEDDLREWIRIWQESGDVLVHGKPPKDRTLKFGRGITLSYCGTS